MILFFNPGVVGFLSSLLPYMLSIPFLATNYCLLLFVICKRLLILAQVKVIKLFSTVFQGTKRLIFVLGGLFLVGNAWAQNPIVTENALPGNPISEWESRHLRISGT
jgi:hypothetical protein